jgi:NitT/TauT family transport system permease protein
MTVANHRWRGSLVLIAALLALWQGAFWAMGDLALRSPWQTVSYLGELITRPAFAGHFIETASAFSAALVIAVAAGMAIGLLLGMSRLAGDVLEPMLVAIYSVPKVTLYPILLLAFGLGMPAKIAFGAIHGFIPIALFTINAVRNVRPILLKTGRVLGMSRARMITRIIIPAALPEIFTGLRVGFALTMIGTVLGEMFASQRGLGYMLMNAIGLHNVDVIIAVTLLLVVFAATVSSILLSVDRRLHKRT